MSINEIILCVCVQGGIYVFQLMDHYTAVVSLMFLAFFEVLAITLIFGEFHFLQSAHRNSDQKLRCSHCTTAPIEI